MLLTVATYAERVIEHLRARIEAKNLTQSELARRATFAQPAISSVLNKKRPPTVAFLQAMVCAASIHLEDLLTEQEIAQLARHAGIERQLTGEEEEVTIKFRRAPQPPRPGPDHPLRKQYFGRRPTEEAEAKKPEKPGQIAA